MSSLQAIERRSFETFLGMSSGYVLDFSDYTFGEFVSENTGLDIHSQRYTNEGTSKAKKLRAFWKLESDHIVGKLLLALIDHGVSLDLEPQAKALADRSRQIATRLFAGGPSLTPLKEQAKVLNAKHLAEQIRRMESSIEADPSLAIGTAKELIATCCKTILAERGKPVVGTPRRLHSHERHAERVEADPRGYSGDREKPGAERIAILGLVQVTTVEPVSYAKSRPCFERGAARDAVVSATRDAGDIRCEVGIAPVFSWSPVRIPMLVDGFLFKRTVLPGRAFSCGYWHRLTA